MHVQLGQRLRFLPGQYDQAGRPGKDRDYNVRLGTVVYINKQHRYFILEDVDAKYRESYKFSQAQKGLVR